MNKKKAAPAADDKPAKVEKPEFKYNVKTLETDLATSGINVRTRLRKLEIPKNGSSYGWNTKTDYDAVLKQLKADIDKPRAVKEPKEPKAAKEPKAGKAAKPSAAAKPATLKKKGAAKPSAAPAPAAETKTDEPTTETKAEPEAATEAA